MALRMKKNCDKWVKRGGNQKLCRVRDVYTFCSPRVGNPAFAELHQTVMK